MNVPPQRPAAGLFGGQMSKADLLAITAAPNAAGAAPDLTAYPVRMDRRGLAAFITKEFFPVSPRSLEVWPLTWVHVNGKAVGLTAEAAAVAKAKLDKATPIRGGKRAAEPSATA